ncbi:MAG TPA: tetratricopeptide repeat protein [Pyrinomonadaceae bacterium]|nr:tetratricopeptide repeat protein [Pyrinomonadaceae bacterium]
MFHRPRKRFGLIGSFPILLSFSILICAGMVRAQETSGDLSGGAGIFRPRNPEAKRSSNRPTVRPTRPNPVRPNPAEIEEKFEDALADGNDARDARKYPVAEASYRAALKLKPRDARAHYGLGNVFTDQQRWDEAEKIYRQAIDIAPSNAEAMMALSFVLVQPRNGGSNATRFTEAESFARRATQIQPKSALAFDRLGVARVARGLFNSDTESAFRRSMELDPGFVVAQVHLARVLRQMNRNNEADPLYKSAIEKAQDAPTLVLIADAMQSESRWSDSDPVLRRALELDARNPGALFLMGRLLSVNRKYGEAEAVLKTAVEVNPKFFPAQNILARSYLGLERYDDAARIYEAAVPLASDVDRRQLAGMFGFGGVGDGYMKTGRPKDALRAYERGLQLDPANAELPNKIAAARARL